MIAHFEVDVGDLMALQRDAIKKTKFHKRNKLISGIAGSVATLFLGLVTHRRC